MWDKCGSETTRYFIVGVDSALDMDDELHKNDSGPSCMGSQPCMDPQSPTLHGESTLHRQSCMDR